MQNSVSFFALLLYCLLIASLPFKVSLFILFFVPTHLKYLRIKLPIRIRRMSLIKLYHQNPTHYLHEHDPQMFSWIHPLPIGPKVDSWIAGLVRWNFEGPARCRQG